MSILKTDSLTKNFGILTAVDSLNISVELGEVFGLVGPNGAGKTTVVKMLTTLLRPTRGTASVAGFDILRNSGEVRHRIGYVPQLISVDGSLTGYENLLIFSKLYDIPRAERQARIGAALEFMGLSEVADKLVRHYSGGMIRRLEVAQAMLHRPSVLFLDEPTVGLDPVARRTVWDHLRKLRSEFGTTIFVTTHYMDEADEMCDHLAVMHSGKMVIVGTPLDLKASIGGDKATLDDVFAHYTGYEIETGGSYREASRIRRAARRLA